MQLGDKTQARAEQQGKQNAARKLAITIGEWRADRIDTAQRRWPFELIQNACDTAKSRGTANLKLEFDIDGDELVFRHTAGHFDIDEICALVYGGSSKPYAAESDYLGRFGTGFLVTHVVSRRVQLSGQAADEHGKYEFSLNINRRSNDPDELVASIDATFGQLNDARLVADGGGWTEFKYPLEDDIGREAVTRGLLELESELPFVLAFNKIAEITIRGKTYRAREEKWGDRIRSVSVGESRVFITDGDESEVEVAIDTDSEGVRTLDGRPRIYAALPLVETASYVHTPFVLNSEEFVPTESRDSLKDDAGARNRELLEKGFGLYPRLLTVLADQTDVSKLYHSFDCRPIEEKRQKENPLWRKANELLAECAQKIGAAISGVQTEQARLPLAETQLPDNHVHGEQLPEPLFNRYVGLFRAICDSVPSDDELREWLRVRRSLAWIDEKHLPEIVKCDEFLGSLQDEVIAQESAKNLTVTQFGERLGLPSPERFLRRICKLGNDLRAAGIRLDAGEIDHLVPNQEGVLGRARGQNGKPLIIDEGIPAKLKNLSERIGWGIRAELAHGDFSQFDIVESLCGTRLDETAVMKRLMSPEFVRERKVEQRVEADEKCRVAWIRLFWWCLEAANPPTDLHVITKAYELRHFQRRDAPELIIPLQYMRDYSDRHGKFNELFPDRRVMHKEYFGVNTRKRVASLEARCPSILVSIPSYRTERQLRHHQLSAILEDDSEVAKRKHRIKSDDRMSAIPFWGKIIGGVSDRKDRARRLVEFVIRCVAPLDYSWREPVKVSCNCGEKSHRVLPSLWLAGLKADAWVPIDITENGEVRTVPREATAEGIESLFDEGELEGLLDEMGEDAEDLLGELGFDRFTLRTKRRAAQESRPEREIRDEMAELVDVAAEVPELISVANRNIVLFKESISELASRQRDEEKIAENKVVGENVERIIAWFAREHDLEVRPRFSGADLEIWPDPESGWDAGRVELHPGPWLLEVKFTRSSRAHLSARQAHTARSAAGRFVCIVVPGSGEVRKQLTGSADKVAEFPEVLRATIIRESHVVRGLGERLGALPDPEEIELDLNGYWLKRALWEECISLEDWLLEMLGT